MKILMLTPYLPYPTNSGGQIRSNNLIKHLSKKHEITLCSLIKNPADIKYAEKLKPYCKSIHIFDRPAKPWTIQNIIKTGFSRFPFLVIRNFSPDEKKELPRIIEEGNFDIIHAETFYVSPHIPDTKIPIVLVDQTIEYRVYEHYVKNYRIPGIKRLMLLDVIKIKHWESYYWKKSARVVAVSEQDAQIMRQTVPSEKVRIVPNGVGDDFTADTKLHMNNKILFMGNYDWLQNSEAAKILAQKVFPNILKNLPDAKLIIAGQGTQKISDLAGENIEVVNLESDDIAGVQKLYRTSGVLVAPLYGPGGSRLKILSAMAARLPVVTTSVGISGIEADKGKDYLLGETAQEIADKTVEILKDKKRYQKIADSARKFVEDHYFYEAISDKLDAVYQEVTSG